MNNYNILNQNESTKRFYLYLIFHLAAWTLAAGLFRLNLPLDAIEGTIWGHQFQLGYDKDPFMNAWLTALATHLSPTTGWSLYLFAQSCVAISMWVTWKLGKEILNPPLALLSVLLLEGIQYFNFHALDFNDNTLELGVWSLICLSFYRSLKNPSNFNWIMLGLLCGIGLMTKYFVAALLAAMGLLLLWNPTYRQLFKKPTPYLALLSCLAVITPHLIWLHFHDYITVHYVFARGSSDDYGWIKHILFPIEFSIDLIAIFLPSLFLFALLFLGKQQPKAKLTVKPQNKQFLLFMGLGPMLLTLLLSVITGSKLRAGWGMPLMTFWILILFMYVQPRLSSKKLKICVISGFIFTGLLTSIFIYTTINPNKPRSANFPGQLIARAAEQLWQQRYHRKLEYVAGSRWIGGNIAFYSKNKPAVMVEWDQAKAAWIDEKDLREKGALFAWDIDEGESMPKDIYQRFPTLSKPMILYFNWQRNEKGFKPQKVGFAFLPPQTSSPDRS